MHDLGGSGDPVVLAHGAGLHGRVWEPLAARLAERFRCLAVDLRGHGGSPLPPRVALDWPGFARDVLAAVDGLGLDRPFGVGHSSGATSLLLAEEARSATFRRLYCFEPVFVPRSGRDTDGRSRRLAAAARRRRDRFPSREDARAAYRSKPPFEAFAPEALVAYVEHGFDDLDDGTVGLRCRPETEAAVYETAADHDGLARLHAVSCPVAVACGSRTDVLTPELAAAVAARLPRGRVEIVDGVGHFGPFEDPAAVAAAIEGAFASP